MTDRADPARAESLTVLDGVPEGCGIFLGEAHDLLCVAVPNKVGLLMCSEYWHTVSNTRTTPAENEPRRLALGFLACFFFFSTLSLVWRKGRGPRLQTHLLHTIEVSISDVPLIAITDFQAPGQRRLVQVHE